jgi:pyrroline-5-carboxylate reductase
MKLDRTIGFLGYGNMGQAIANGLIRVDIVSPEHIAAYDMDAEKLNSLKALGGTAADSMEDLARRSQVLVLATKPQDMDAALDSLRSGDSTVSLYISIAAGLSIAYFQEHLGADAHIVRVMPNTPAMVGAGASGIALSETCTEDDGRIADAIFGAVGISERVSEADLDAVTALSGSGPAYYFYLVECFVRAGTMLGLHEDQATKLAAQTLHGAGLLLKESSESAAELRERVTSKGGTTYAALESFRASGLEDAVYAAMKAAADRSKELGK